MVTADQPRPDPFADLFRAVRDFVAFVAPATSAVGLRIDLADGKAFVSPVPVVRQEEFRLINADCSCVAFRGVVYTFSTKQAAIVRRLLSAHEEDAPDVGAAELHEAAESDAKRLRDLFRSGGSGHPAWLVLIVRGERDGHYRLNLSPRKGV